MTATSRMERWARGLLAFLGVQLLLACGTPDEPASVQPVDSEQTWRVVEWGNPERVKKAWEESEPAEGPPPTIVLMIADDQHYQDFGFGDNPAAYTPRLDRMAREGALFPVTHVGMSRCRPSLACLLAGTYPHQNGVYYNFSARQLDPTLDTLPRQLAGAGFACWAGGKYWEGNPRRLGFSHAGQSSRDLARENQNSVIAFLERTQGQPVFLWWAPMLPHVPHNPPARLLDLIDPQELERPDYIPEERETEWREEKRIILAMGAWLDEGVAQLMDILEEHNRLENTLIVFLVDNGYEEHVRAKGTAYERGFRTPVILWEPRRVEPGLSFDSLVSTLDLLPTILEWAGAETPPHFVGRSLWPLIENPQTPWRDRLFGADYPRRASSKHHPAAHDDVQALYVRTHDWKYIAFVRDVVKGSDAGRDYYSGWFDEDEIRAGDELLFDLSRDPEEIHNLANEPAHADRVRDFRGEVFEWWRETGGGPLPIAPGDFD